MTTQVLEQQTQTPVVPGLEQQIMAAEAKTQLGEDVMLMVTFKIADQIYGGDILQIQEVTEMSPITRVPHLQDYISGVSNLRGHIVPTVDLAVRLNLAEKGQTQGRQIMIARTEQGLVGFIVDEVSEVIPVPKDRIEPTPEGWMDGDHKYFGGIAKLESSLVSIVDFARLLQLDKIMLEEYGQQGGK
jgi:purine-binding chemotaxis protein CheW